MSKLIHQKSDSQSNRVRTKTTKSSENGNRNLSVIRLIVCIPNIF